MDDQKKTYYIDVGHGQISQSSTASTWSFKIQANDEEITQLRELFDQNYSIEWQNFFRAHVPYVNIIMTVKTMPMTILPSRCME